jgi:predicted ATPase
MIKSIRFKADWRCFKEGDYFEFEPGVNLLVGDQGTGKSSILTLFRWATNQENELKRVADLQCEGLVELRIFDFERDNPRTRGYVKFAADVYMRYQSHGNCVLALLDVLEEQDDTRKCFILDEPDMALSIRSINKVVAKLQASKHQIIAAAHNPFLIRAFPQVLSVEHKHWMPSEEFIASHSQ